MLWDRYEKKPVKYSVRVVFGIPFKREGYIDDLYRIKRPIECKDRDMSVGKFRVKTLTKLEKGTGKKK